VPSRGSSTPRARKPTTPLTAKELIAAFLEKVGGFIDPLEADLFFQNGCPGMKPHGRLCWSIHLGSGPVLDISVMPRTDPPFPDPPIVLRNDE